MHYSEEKDIVAIYEKLAAPRREHLTRILEIFNEEDEELPDMETVVKWIFINLQVLSDVQLACMKFELIAPMEGEEMGKRWHTYGTHK
jgi:hypothetical protein